jgi:hypothetical protein
MPVAKDGAEVDHDPPQETVPSVRLVGADGVSVDTVPPAFGDLGPGAGDEIEIRRLTPGERLDVGLERAGPKRVAARALDAGGGVGAQRVAARALDAGGGVGAQRVAARALDAGGGVGAQRVAARARVLDGSPRARRHAMRQMRMDRWETPAGRRAELVAAASAMAVTVAASETAFGATPSKRGGRLLRRLVALVAIVLLPAAAAALVTTRTPVTPLSHADASFIAAQLSTADRQVRAQLVHLRGHATTRARARTRESIATTGSLALEVRYARGAEAGRLQHALRLERDWLDAVGSTLSNPRSPLRTDLMARDRPLRLALAAITTPAGRRMGATQHLVGYARSRVRAAGRGVNPPSVE